MLNAPPGVHTCTRAHSMQLWVWKIFQIKDNDLIDVTYIYVKKSNNRNYAGEIFTTKMWYLYVDT